MVTRVIIVRHGQSDYNAQGIIQGRCDESVLTEKGQADARLVGQTLGQIKLDAVYCSPLQRAKRTAEIVCTQLSNSPTLQPSNLLMEIDLPQWEKLSKKEVAEKYAEDYRRWKQQPAQFKMFKNTAAGTKEHYPVLSLYDQARDFWQKIIPKHWGETIAIVAHNGINRCLIMSAIGIPPERYHTIQQSNCGISVLNFTGGVDEAVQLESLNQTAHMGVKLPTYRQSHQGPRLLLVRHGETDWNRESRFQGIRDIPLNENGRVQAGRAADFLSDVKLDFAVTSPMLRPKETAEIILQSHPQIKLAIKQDLQEIGHGLWEGKLKSDVETEFPGMLQQWQTAPETVQMPEGENLQQVWQRGVAAWQEIVAQYAESTSPQTGIVVAHDAINKVILCYLLGLNSSNFWNIKQGNGAVSVIDYPNGVNGFPVLQAINLTSHLGNSIIDQTAAGAL